MNLDLSNSTLVFDETFNNPLKVLDIPAGTGWGDGVTPHTWYCHTPSSSDFGSSYFSGPQDAKDGVSPFSIDPVTGQLKIIAWFDSTASHWRSGLLSTMDYTGKGFTLANGYYEAQMKCPGTAGVWPAFWLESANNIKGRTTDVAEIDVCELYGVDMTKSHQTLHVWTPSGGQPIGVGNTSDFTPTKFCDAPHQFGVLVNTDTMYFYIDRVFQWSVATPPSANQPLFMMINLAMGGGWPLEDLFPNGGYPPTLVVDYVRAWKYAPPNPYPIPAAAPTGSFGVNASWSDPHIAGFVGNYWNRPAEYPNAKVVAVYSASAGTYARLQIPAPGAIASVTLVDLATNTPKTLVHNTDWVTYLDWQPNQQVVVFNAPVATTSHAVIIQ